MGGIEAGWGVGWAASRQGGVRCGAAADAAAGQQTIFFPMTSRNELIYNSFLSVCECLEGVEQKNEEKLAMIEQHNTWLYMLPGRTIRFESFEGKLANADGFVAQDNHGDPGEI